MNMPTRPFRRSLRIIFKIRPLVFSIRLFEISGEVLSQGIGTNSGGARWIMFYPAPGGWNSPSIWSVL